METASPVAYHYHSSIPPRQLSAKTPQTPRFGAGIGDAVSAGVGIIDSNRFVELVCSDLFAMIFPRTAIAHHERGVDDARETFIREFSGLVGNMFVVGWAGQLAVAALGGGVNAYNPHGIPAKAWVSSTNMGAFSDLYKASLEKATSAKEARTDFIETILKGLESGDKTLSIDGRLASLRRLEAPQAQAALAQMVETVHGEEEAMHQLPRYQELLTKGNTAELRNLFLQNGWGRLSEESQEVLAEFYDQANGLKPSIKGTHNFDIATTHDLRGDLWAQTQDKLDAFEAKLAQKNLKPKEYEKQLELFRDQLFAKHRLDLSLADLGKPTEHFEKAISQEALERGLTSTIHLRNLTSDTPTTRAFLSAGQSRNTFLKELKFFLEQYVDRASHGADMAADWKQHIQEALFKKSKQGWLHPIWPSIEDGLITATRKSKFMYTAVPMVTSILTAGAFTFFNQWLTRRKHGGKVFFPGELAGFHTSKASPIGSSPSQTLAFSSKPSSPYQASSASFRPPYPTPPHPTPPHPFREGILA